MGGDHSSRYRERRRRACGFTLPLRDWTPMNATFQREFIGLCIDLGVLKFGRFKLKSGRESPYFFNAGLFNTGTAIAAVGRAYAAALAASTVKFDMVFGPAYKGIPLVTVTAAALATHHGVDLPFAFNRKEAKDHGEGGTIVGAKLTGKVVIIDDVISAGTSVRESVEMIRAAGATPCAVLIALDRMERSGKDGALSAHSAVQEVSQAYGMPVISIGNLNDLFGYLSSGAADARLAQYKDAVAAYRTRYGVE